MSVANSIRLVNGRMMISCLVLISFCLSCNEVGESEKLAAFRRMKTKGDIH